MYIRHEETISASAPSPEANFVRKKYSNLLLTILTYRFSLLPSSACVENEKQKAARRLVCSTKDKNGHIELRVLHRITHSILALGARRITYVRIHIAFSLSLFSMGDLLYINTEGLA